MVAMLAWQTYCSSAAGRPKLWALEMLSALGCDLVIAATSGRGLPHFHPGPVVRAAIVGTFVGLAKRSCWPS